jgi:hypothetical protein
MSDIRIGQKVEWELIKHFIQHKTSLRSTVGFMQLADETRIIGKRVCYRTFCFFDDSWIYYGYCPAGEMNAPEVTLPLKEIEETLYRVDKLLGADSMSKRWLNDLQLKTHVHVSLVMIQNYNNYEQNKSLRHNE